MTFYYLELTTVNHEHVPFVFPFSYHEYSLLAGDLRHPSNHSINIVVIEILEKKERFESEQNTTVHS